MLDARLSPGLGDPLRGGGLDSARAGRAVDVDPGVDGDDVDTRASELLGDRGTDADGTSGHNGDGHGHPFGRGGLHLEREPFEGTARGPLGEQVLVAEEVAVATAVGAAARIQHGRVTLEVEPRGCARGHERAVVVPRAEDDVGPRLLGLLRGLERLHSPRRAPDRLRHVVRAHDHEVREVVGGDGLLAGRRHDEHVGEAVRGHAVEAEDAVLPLLFHRDATASDDRVPGPPGNGVSSASKPVASTMQSTGYSSPLATTPCGVTCDPSRAVDQRDLRVVERHEVLVVEARSLAAVAVEGLEHLRGGRVADERLDARPVLLHDVEVVGLDHRRDVRRRHALGDRGVVQLCGVQGPAVTDEVLLDRTPDHHRAEVLHALPLPARLQLLAELRRRRAVAALADGRRRALEHVHVLRRLAQRRHRLDAAGPHADDGDDLVGELVEVWVVGRTAGVVVVPLARCGTPCPRTRPSPGSWGASSG